MTDSADVALVDAFTTEPMAGTPAGVVPDATGIAADGMSAIAGELGASETAFVRDRGDDEGEADYGLRWFTPDGETDRPGHATVAAFALLAERGAVPAGTHAVGTGAGTVDVEVTGDGTVWVTRSPPEIRTVEVSIEEAAAALGLDTAALSGIGEDLPIARASAGRPVLVVPVGYFEELSAVAPDRAPIEALCDRTDTEALYAFTFDTLGRDATLHGRVFAPPAGRGGFEEPATGTASGAVGAYLRRHGALDAPDPLVFERGHFLDRPGRVQVRTGDEAPAVGGRAVTVLDGDLVVPERGGDDIVEA